MKLKADDNENRNSFDLLLKNPDGSFLVFSPAEPKRTNNCLLVSFCFSVGKGRVIVNQLFSIFYIFFRYQIVVGNEDRRFRVDPTSGKIYIHAPLDRETKSTYSLKVKASDSPSQAANQKSSVIFVNVTLTDVNDNKPLFKKGSYYAAVTETASIGDDLITVQATDADAGLWRRFVFLFQKVGQISSQ